MPGLPLREGFDKNNPLPVSALESTFTSLTPFNPPSAFWRGQGPDDHAYFREEGMWALISEMNSLLQVHQLASREPGFRPGTLNSNSSPFPPKGKRREKRKEGRNGREGRSCPREGDLETQTQRSSRSALLGRGRASEGGRSRFCDLQAAWFLTTFFCKVEVVMSISQSGYKNK